MKYIHFVRDVRKKICSKKAKVLRRVMHPIIESVRGYITESSAGQRAQDVCKLISISELENLSDAFINSWWKRSRI